jgi:hypothetical protein
MTWEILVSLEPWDNELKLDIEHIFSADGRKLMLSVYYYPMPAGNMFIWCDQSTGATKFLGKFDVQTLRSAFGHRRAYCCGVFYPAFL